MELRQLKCFVYVAELRSFSKAANHLRVAQPAISKAVQALEKHLNCRLFLRTSRAVELTPAGRILLSRAHSILRQLEQTEQQIAEHAHDITGSVTIGVPPAVGEVIMPSVMQRLAKLHPGIFIDLVEGVGVGLYNKLLNQEISAGLIHDPVPHKELDIRPMFVEELYLIGPPAPALGLVPVDKIEDLENIPMILPDRRHMRRLLVERLFSERGMRLNLRMQADGIVMVRSLVSSGIGYSVLSKGAIANELAMGRLSTRPFGNPPLTWTLSLVTRSGKQPNPVFETVCTAIHAEVAANIARGIYRVHRDLSAPP